MISLLDFRVLENEPLCSCGGFLRIQVAYEYLSRTLQEDFERRQQNNRMYSEEEVRRVLVGVLKGLEEVYRMKVKTGGFAAMDLIVLEGSGDQIEKIKVLNPNLNRLGDLIEESEASGEDLQRIELVHLGVIACRMLTNYNYSIEDWKAKVHNKLSCSKALRNIISKLLQGDSMIKDLIRLLEDQNKKNKEPLEDISSRKLNERPEESFVWKGLEIEESGTETNRLEESLRKVADVSNWDLLGDCQQQVQDVSKPIITLNYCSPDRKKATPWDDILDFTKENHQDFSKENYDFGKDFMNFSRNY